MRRGDNALVHFVPDHETDPLAGPLARPGWLDPREFFRGERIGADGEGGHGLLLLLLVLDEEGGVLGEGGHGVAERCHRLRGEDGGVGRPALEGDVDVFGDAALGVVHSRGGGLHGVVGEGGVKGKSEE